MPDDAKPADEEPGMVDAIALLKSDHRKVEDLFTQYEAAESEDDKAQLARQICLELKIHTMIEEEIFYPAIEGEIDEDMLDEAFVEHDGAKVLVNDIESGSPADEYYDAKVTVLSEQIKHHVNEEERPDTGMFAQARASGVDLIELGAELKTRKQQLLEAAEADGLPMASPAVVNLITQ